MLSVDYPKFETYLQSISEKYKCWWNLYTLTDAESKKTQEKSFSSPFDFELMVQTVQPKQEQENQEQENIERLPVLEGIRKYADNHVLLRGKPGSGKSTALARLLLEEARAYLDINSATNSINNNRIPILIELRYWQTSIFERIQAFLKQHDVNLNLDETTLKNLLRQGKFLLLIDGVNELPSEEARRQVGLFRKNFSQTPMIFTTRDLSVGGDLGIEKKLEMQPLNETQMRDFVMSYLPQQGGEMLQRLGNRLQEFGKTPLLLWMLCGLFQQTGNIPSNLGMVFRLFTESYENNLRGDVAVTAESRRWWKSLLEHLAFVMMQGEPVTEFRVAIPKREVEEIFTKYLTEEKFDKPRDYAKCWLEDLIKHHLIQVESGDKIEFRHQLLQEYYAAEYLLTKLPDISDRKLQHDYLNLLKWTEPVALMLALVEEEARALKVVRLALEVDLMLGARLAGEVRKEFQEKTTNIINELKIPQINKKLLFNNKQKTTLKEIRKNENINYENNMIEIGALQPIIYVKDGLLIQDYTQAHDSQNKKSVNEEEYFRNIERFKDNLKSQDFMTRFNAAKMLGDIGSDTIIDELCQAYDAEFTEHPMNFVVRLAIIQALEEIGSNKAIATFDKALNDEHFGIRNVAINGLIKIGSESVVSILVKALKDKESYIRESAAEAFGLLGYGKAISELHKILFNEHEYSVFWRVAEAIKLIQERCKYYNHEIFYSLPLEEECEKPRDLDELYQRFKNMSEAPKYDFRGAKVDKVIDTINDGYHEYNYASENNIDKALAELKPILEKIQHQHPTTNEQQATDIIEVEFREIERSQPAKWQEILRQLISLKRWFNGSKSAASETIKHYLNDSVQAKAFIAFLEAFSAD